MFDRFISYLPPAISTTAQQWRDRFAPHGSVRERFAGAVFWSVAGLAFSNLTGLVTGAALARILGREGYGEVGVIVGSYALFSQLGGLGLGVTAAKYSAEARATKPAAVGGLLGGLLVLATLSYAIAAIALVVLGSSLADLLNRPSLVGPIRLSALVLFFQGLDSIQSGILSGFEAFRPLARVTMLRGLVNLAASVAGAWFFGLYGAVAAMAITGLFTLFFNRLALDAILRRDRVTLIYRLDWGLLKPLWQFSLPAFLSATLTMVAAFVLNAMLVNQPGGYDQMGLFNAANQWRALGIFVATVFSPPLLSIQTNLFASNNRRAYHRSISGNLLLQTAVSAAVAVVLAVVAPYLMRMYGAQYHDGAGVLALLAFGWVTLAPSWILWIAAVSRGDVWQGLLLNAIGVATLIGLARGLAADGARGIALACLYAGLIQVALQGLHYFMTRRTDLAGAALKV